MPRPILDETHTHPAIRQTLQGWHADTLREVQQAVAQHPVLVIGMAQNPFCSRARKALDAAGIAHQYLEYKQPRSCRYQRNHDRRSIQYLIRKL